MLLAVVRQENGKKLLVIGLYTENMERLHNDMPIWKVFEVEGIEELKDWEMTILGPEDTARFIAHSGIKVKK